MKKYLLFLLLVLNQVVFAQITLLGSAYVGTGSCSAGSANRTYNINGTYNGKNLYESGFSGQFGVVCSFIIRWNSSTLLWELVSKEQSGQASFTYTVRSTLVGDYAAPPCGAAFGGSLSGSCYQNCSPTMTVPTNTNICSNATQAVVIAASGCGGTVSWSNGSTGSSISVLPTVTTIYTASCSTASVCTADATVTVKPAPTAAILSESPTCSLQSITASLCVQCSNNSSTVLWSNGITNLCQDVSISTTTTYSVACTNSGCTGPPDVRTFIINPTLAISKTPTSAINGQNQILTATNCSGNVSWNTGATTSAITVAVTTTNTTYTATCIRNGAGDCNSSNFVNVVACLVSNKFLANNQPILNEIANQTLANYKANLDKSTATFEVYDIFSLSKTVNELRNTFVANNSSIQLDLNSLTLKNIEDQRPSFLSLSVPVSAKTTMILELIPNNIFAEGFKVVDAQNNEVGVPLGIHYKGVIKGDKNSLVAISIVNGEVSGIISNAKGNFVLGKMKNSSNYIFYNDKELVQKSTFSCGVTNDSQLKSTIENASVKSISALDFVACRAVQVYMEADNSVFNLNGSCLSNTTAYVNSIFNQVAVLYSNEGINIVISQLKIWDTPDPYISAASSAPVLSSFANQIGNNFTGDIAHLMSARSLGGGVGQLNVLCSKGKAITGNLDINIQNVPVYTWDVVAITHEIGHNFGSLHTQSCTWPGGPIDNCVAVEDGFCDPGPAPVNGGTIMSYCHLAAYGVNLNNGFGTLPGNLIRFRTQVCIGNAVTPTNLTAVDVYNTSVVLAWQNTMDGTFTVEYRQTSSVSWVSAGTVTTNTIRLDGLIANTSYDWRVKIGCSAFVTASFTTNGTAPPAAYCSINYSAKCYTSTDLNMYNNNGVGGVNIEGTNLSMASGCSSGGYSLFNNTPKDLLLGQTFNFTLTMLSNNQNQASIWIDLNKNSVFEASEQVFATTQSSNTLTITGSFTLPNNISIQTRTRMRVIITHAQTITSACGNYDLGETEDYLVNLTSLCPQIVNETTEYTTGTTLRQANALTGVITATNVITGAGTKVTYQAKSIILNPNFKADNGTIFKAEIGGCN